MDYKHSIVEVDEKLPYDEKFPPEDPRVEVLPDEPRPSAKKQAKAQTTEKSAKAQTTEKSTQPSQVVQPEKESKGDSKEKSDKKAPNHNFWERQKELIEKWNNVWGKEPPPKPKRTKPKPKPRPPAEYWCEDGKGKICKNKAAIRLASDTAEWYFVTYLCAQCFQDHRYNKHQSELPAGVWVTYLKRGTCLECQKEVFADLEERGVCPSHLCALQGAKRASRSTSPATAASPSSPSQISSPKGLSSASLTPPGPSGVPKKSSKIFGSAPELTLKGVSNQTPEKKSTAAAARAPVVPPQQAQQGVPAKAASPVAAPSSVTPPASAPPSPPRGVAFVFNGQGAQEVGMTKDCQALPAVKKLFETANSILGYDLQQLCLEGPENKLNSTEYSQPAMLVAGLAAAEKLKHHDKDLVASCTATAGLSLGEYTALVFAGALTYEDALKLIKVRATAMSEAARAVKGGMLSVAGLEDAKLQEICSKATTSTSSGDMKMICQIANYLMPGGRVVAGHEAVLDKVLAMAQEAKALKVQKLYVSGAFHTPLMAPAAAALDRALASTPIAMPRIPVYSNLTAKPYSSVEEIRAGLSQQLMSPVQWEQSIVNIIKDGNKQFYELAPRGQLTVMVRRIDRDVGAAMKLVKV